MRTTIDLDPQLHELVRRQAQREKLSMARLLGRLVEQGLRKSPNQSLPMVKSGRFQVTAPASPGARVTTEQVQKLIDEEGVL